ncbi:carbon-nitrogen family hydrolase [Verrucomicrobiales bacterium]|nr:carbon-nitrogen family hydrolase [Verrucomicrobiales bacterium]MDB4527029.1 carbon-nitrogen family hydrolase [bacterium]MDB4772492.1 carbon-nitrogen family hydrolase [Verrucomicrobiales bacterium]MDC0503510.1 carbon-nitrogen family hydrolase [Verrucomicrobiales bacterium]MDF1788753.1 carbon-nitrogen family hydrolase [Verrucomicrobiales bacterium]
MAIITILLAQLDVLWRNPTGNLSRLQRHLVDIEGDDQQLLVLPEMLSTGFTDDLDNLTEAPHGPWESSLMNELNVPTILGIARRQPDGRITNEAVYLKPDQAKDISYRKIRPFRSEHKVVTAGSEVITFDHAGVCFCPLICYDLRFPELFRTGLRQGAEVFIVIASWPASRQHHWELLLRARAVENQAYVVGVNRCGDDPNFHYSGGSMVIDPLGEIVYHAGESESVTRVDIDAQRVKDWRSEFPGTRDYLSQPDLA